MLIEFWSRISKMIVSGVIKISILFFFVLTVAMVTEGKKCAGTVDRSSILSGLITSPNYPYEYGARENFTWSFTVPNHRYLLLDVFDLQLHFADHRGRLQCRPNYSLKINGERLGCDPPKRTDWSLGKNLFCMQFQNPNCLAHPYCNVTRKITDRVVITYEASGAIIPHRDWTPHMLGFKIRYSRLHCQRWKSNVTDVTWQHKATPETSFNSVPQDNGFASQKTAIPTLPTFLAMLENDQLSQQTAVSTTASTVKKANDSSYEPECVTNATHSDGQYPRMKSRVSWTSVLEGGAVILILLLLIAVMCKCIPVIREYTQADLVLEPNETRNEQMDVSTV